MKILHLSTTASGGAWKATYRLHQCFRDHDLQSAVLVKEPLAADREEVTSLAGFQPSLFSRAVKKGKKLFASNHFEERSDPDYCFFNRNEKDGSTSADILRAIHFTPDVIILHWISRFVGSRTIRELQQTTGAKLFWYMVDMAPLTGGCHYAWDCAGFTEHCGRCPALRSNSKEDESFWNLQSKKKNLQDLDITLIAPSERLFVQTQQSSLFRNKPLFKIPIAIDDQIYRPIDKSIGRHVFNIPLEKKVILVGALQLKERRKGLSYLLEALKILDPLLQPHEKQNLCLLLVGEAHDAAELWNEVRFQKFFAGKIQDDRLMALAYQTSDLLVCPSIEDSGPMVINEALMCGTPVVSFRMGVAEDLVIDGQTGHLTDLYDCSGLAHGILKILRLPAEEYNQLSAGARSFALEHLSPEVQYRSFMQLLNNNTENRIEARAVER